MKTTVEIVGLPIANASYEEVIDKIRSYLEADRKVYAVTANPEMTLNAISDEYFYDVLMKAELLTPDGIGMLWAAYYLSLPKKKGSFKKVSQLLCSLSLIALRPRKLRTVLKERVTGADLFPKIVEASQKENWSIFLLGSAPGVAKKAIKQLKTIYPGAKFSGCFSGSPHQDDEDEICECINQAKPDLLFVAYGSPNQEFWICRNLFKLNTVKLAIGVGGAFDFYAGKIKRAPNWMRRFGLEWCWRLIRQPLRFKRIWNATFRFIKLIYGEKNR